MMVPWHNMRRLARGCLDLGLLGSVLGSSSSSISIDTWPMFVTVGSLQGLRILLLRSSPVCT